MVTTITTEAEYPIRNVEKKMFLEVNMCAVKSQLDMYCWSKLAYKISSLLTSEVQ